MADAARTGRMLRALPRPDESNWLATYEAGYVADGRPMMGARESFCLLTNLAASDPLRVVEVLESTAVGRDVLRCARERGEKRAASAATPSPSKKAKAGVVGVAGVATKQVV